MLSRIKNIQGVTLVELMATLVIISLVATLAYQVLFQGYSNYNRIKVETEIRDEADLIMASLVREIFTLKEKDISAKKFAGPKEYILEYQENGVNYNTGIKSKAGYILVRNAPLYISSSNIILMETSTIVEIVKGEYEVKIVLKNVKTSKEMQFINTIRTIKEQEVN